MTHIEKTEGIVLGTYPVSETSRVVSWLTPDHGRVSTLIKGSQRPKSLFLGQYDLFYTCELLFYPRPKTHLHLAKECCPLKTRDSFRHNYRATAAASYIADLVSRAGPRDAPDPDLFTFTDFALDHLEEHGVSQGFFHWCEMSVMASLGLSPRLSHCMVCHRALSPTDRDYRFSTARGGMTCTSCATAGANGTVIVGADVFAVLRAWQDAATPAEAARIRCSPGQLSTLSKILGRFLEYHLETPLESRAAALRIVTFHPKPPEAVSGHL